MQTSGAPEALVGRDQPASGMLGPRPRAEREDGQAEGLPGPQLSCPAGPGSKHSLCKRSAPAGWEGAQSPGLGCRCLLPAGRGRASPGRPLLWQRSVLTYRRPSGGRNRLDSFVQSILRPADSAVSHSLGPAPFHSSENWKLFRLKRSDSDLKAARNDTCAGNHKRICLISTKQEW